MATWPSEVAKISLRHKHYVTNGSETKRNGQPWVLMSRVLRPTKHIIGHIGDPWVLLNWNKQELSSCWDGRPCRHKRHGPKSGGGELQYSFPLRELGPNLAQCTLGRGLPPYHVASWSIQPFGHNTPTLQTDKQDRQLSRIIGRTVTYGRPKNRLSRSWSSASDNYRKSPKLSSTGTYHFPAIGELLFVRIYEIHFAFWTFTVAFLTCRLFSNVNTSRLAHCHANCLFCVLCNASVLCGVIGHTVSF